MNISEETIEHFFTYHPPQTDERRQAHEAINAAALAFAKTVMTTVENPDCLEMAFFAIQQARMFANQGVTLDEVLH
jgi:hypothetical protein